MGKRSLCKILPTLILSAVFLLATDQIAFAESRSAFIQQEFSEVEKIWPGQRLTLYITLYTNTSFSGSTSFELPEVSGMLVLENEDRPLLGSKDIDGISYIYKRHEIIIFPLRSGVHTLPPLKVEFSIQKEPNQIAEQSFTTKSIKLKILEIPGTTARDKLITTTNLQAREQWQPQPGPARVGDALTRTVTLSADDLPGMVFPPFGLKKVAGLGFYSKPPQVKDQRARGQFTGSRIETITYICEEPGTFKIPGLSFKWWNPKSETLQKVSLPAMTFEVTANPLLGSDALVKPGQKTHNGRQPWQRAAGLILLFSALIGSLFIRLILKRKKAGRKTADQEKELFKKFQQAAIAQDAALTMQTLLYWLDYSKFAGTPGSLTHFCTLAGDLELKKEIEALETFLYTAKHDTEWTGDKLYTAVRQARKNLNNLQSQFKQPSLPELNP